MSCRLAHHHGIELSCAGVATGTIRGITISGVVHCPVGGGKAVAAGAGDGMARLAGNRSGNVGRRFALDGCMAHRAIPGLQMATGATRGNTGVTHRPVGCKTADWADARGGRAMAHFARQRGRNVVRWLAQYRGSDGRARIATVVAAGTSRGNSGVIHRGVRCRKTINSSYTSGSGMTNITFQRGQNMVCRLWLDSAYRAAVTV